MNKNSILKFSKVTISLVFCVYVILFVFMPVVYGQSSVGGPGSGGGTSVGGPGAGSGTTVGGTGGNNSIPALTNPLKNIDSVGAAVNKFVEIFSYIVVLIGVLVIIWIGLQYIFAQGKPDRLKELNKWLLMVVIGITIVLGARIMIQIIVSTLEATGTVDKNIINSVNSAIKK